MKESQENTSDGMSENILEEKPGEIANGIP